MPFWAQLFIYCIQRNCDKCHAAQYSSQYFLCIKNCAEWLFSLSAINLSKIRSYRDEWDNSGVMSYHIIFYEGVDFAALTFELAPIPLTFGLAHSLMTMESCVPQRPMSLQPNGHMCWAV